LRATHIYPGQRPVRNNACLQFGKHTRGSPYMELKTTSGVIGSRTSEPEHVDLLRLSHTHTRTCYDTHIEEDTH